jgi:hypothetical protein
MTWERRGRDGSNSMHPGKPAGKRRSFIREARSPNQAAFWTPLAANDMAAVFASWKARLAF